MGFKSAPEAFYRRGCKPIVGSSQERQKAERPGTCRAARSRSINLLESRKAAKRFVAKATPEKRKEAERPTTCRAARSRSINLWEWRKAVKRFVAKRPLKTEKSGEAGHAPSRAFQEHKSLEWRKAVKRFVAKRPL